MDEMPPIDVLLVEDNPSDAYTVQRALSKSPGFRITHVETLAEALAILAQRTMSVVLLDLGLPDSEGLDALRTLRDGNCGPPIIVQTGKDDITLALQALKEGAQDYLMKGELQPELLERAIRYAIERSHFKNLFRQSEQRVQELTAHVPQVLWMIDAKEAKILYVSAGYDELWGRSCQSLLDNPHSYMEGIHPLDQDLVARENAAMFVTGYIDTECRVLRPTGRCGGFGFGAIRFENKAGSNVWLA